jgi:hypothetical protein
MTLQNEAMTDEVDDRPIDLRDALAPFDALWSPRIVSRVNDYDDSASRCATGRLAPTVW